jgi:hypothetical protein
MHLRKLKKASFVNSTRGLLLTALALVSCAHNKPVAPAAAVAAKPVAAIAAAPPPLSLVPVDVARVGLVATFVIPTLERTLASGVALVKQATPLPLDAAGVRDMLLAQAGLPPEVAKHLDLTAPVAGAAVSAGAGRSPLAAFSFSCRTAVDVAALLNALGRTIEHRGAAVQIESTTGDRGWFLSQGSVVVFADSEDALVRAGALAIEARRTAKDDASVIVYPEMVARAAGTDVKTALDRLLAEIEERTVAGGGTFGPEARQQSRELADYIVGTATAEFAIDLDAARGLSLLARLHPKAGSKLETVARQTRTIAIDPLLLAEALRVKDDVAFVMTSAYATATLDQFRRQRGKLPTTGKPALAMGRLMDALIEGLTGDLSMVGRLQPNLSGEMIYPARDAATGARIQAALATIDKDALTAAVRAATQGEGLDVKVTKAKQETLGKTRTLHTNLAVKSPGDKMGVLRKLIGPTGIEMYAAVVGQDRLAVTVGTGAKARMVSIASGKTPKDGAAHAGPATTAASDKAFVPAASTALTAAIAAASGRSLFYFFDLRQAIALAVTAAGKDPRMRMVLGALRAPMPVLGGASGDSQGTALTVDLTIPPACIAGFGGLVQAAMMMRN